METEIKTVDQGCQQIRHWLPDFLHDRLGAAATGTVQGHLLTCQTCNDIFGEMLMREVESGTEPLVDPPSGLRIPPIAWYDAYLRHRNGRLGLSWGSLRDALNSANTKIREQAREQIEQVSDVLSQLFVPMIMSPAPVRTRGAQSKHQLLLTADVLSSDLKPTDEQVEFTVEEAPHVAGGHFRLRIRMHAAGYEGDWVVCTFKLPGLGAISFIGVLRRIDGSDAWEAEISEDGLLCRAGNVPLEQTDLIVVKR